MIASNILQEHDTENPDASDCWLIGGEIWWIHEEMGFKIMQCKLRQNELRGSNWHNTKSLCKIMPEWALNFLFCPSSFKIFHFIWKCLSNINSRFWSPWIRCWFMRPAECRVQSNKLSFIAKSIPNFHRLLARFTCTLERWSFLSPRRPFLPSFHGGLWPRRLIEFHPPVKSIMSTC